MGLNQHPFDWQSCALPHDHCSNTLDWLTDKELTACFWKLSKLNCHCHSHIDSSQWSYRQQTADSRQQTADSRSRHQTPDTRHQTPDSRHQTPDTRHQTPDTRHQTPDSNRVRRVCKEVRRTVKELRNDWHEPHLCKDESSWKWWGCWEELNV